MVCTGVEEVWIGNRETRRDGGVWGWALVPGGVEGRAVGGGQSAEEGGNRRQMRIKGAAVLEKAGMNPGILFASVKSH